MISKAFSEYLRRMSDHAAALSAGTATDAQFTDLQRMEYLADQNAGRISYDERKALDRLYFMLCEEYREVLGLNEIYKHVTAEGAGNRNAPNLSRL